VTPNARANVDAAAGKIEEVHLKRRVHGEAEEIHVARTLDRQVDVEMRICHPTTGEGAEKDDPFQIRIGIPKRLDESGNLIVGPGDSAVHPLPRLTARVRDCAGNDGAR
jgi:hypothetical protein